MFQYPQFIKPILGIDTDNAINYNTKISINNNIKKNNFKYITPTEKKNETNNNKLCYENDISI